MPFHSKQIFVAFAEMENPSTVFKPVLLPDVDNHRSRLPSASVRPIAQASKIVPPRSRLPTLRNNSVGDVHISC